VPEYTPQINKNDGCLKNFNGFVKKLLKPLIRQGTKGSSPLAFETIALSTIETIGATHIADIIAAFDSTIRRIDSGGNFFNYFVSSILVMFKIINLI